MALAWVDAAAALLLLRGLHEQDGAPHAARLKGLPAGAQVVGYMTGRLADGRPGVALKVYHPDFEPVPDGSAYPTLEGVSVDLVEVTEGPRPGFREFF